MNKPKNTMKVSFPSRGANEGLARMLVAAFITEADPTVEELCDIKTAVSEAVTNCIVHAYPDRIGEIYIAASLSESNLVTIKVRDHGCGIADVQKAMEPLFTTGGSERAGLGFAVMQELMDEVRVTSRAGGGTTVRLRRRLSQKARYQGRFDQNACYRRTKGDRHTGYQRGKQPGAGARLRPSL